MTGPGPGENFASRSMSDSSSMRMPPRNRRELPTACQRISRLRADAERLGVVGSGELGARGNALARDLDLPATRRHELVADAVGMRDVAEPDGATDRVTVRARCQTSDQRPVPPDRLVVVEERFGVVDHEHDEPAS